MEEVGGGTSIPSLYRYLLSRDSTHISYDEYGSEILTSVPLSDEEEAETVEVEEEAEKDGEQEEERCNEDVGGELVISGSSAPFPPGLTTIR